MFFPPHLEIISVHVPKTAGTTFGNLLEQIYGRDGVYFDYPGKKRENSEVDRNRCQVIHGHFAASKYKNCPDRVKKIAWIRNPIDRLISHYFFWKSSPISEQMGNLHQRVIKENFNLLEFAKLPLFQNHISRAYINLEIDAFYFIGIHEFFAEDWQQLTALLGFPALAVYNKNSNLSPNYRAYKTSQEYRNILLELLDLNSKDMQLYQKALQKRYQRMSSARR